MFLNKLRGKEMAVPQVSPLKNIGLAWVGGFLAIATLAALSDYSTTPLMLGSFGASCVLLFGFPDAPFSQPRNVVFGHIISALLGLTFLYIFGPHWWSVALAAGTSIAAMMITRTVHPPAGSNPIIIFLSQPTWGFLIFPVAIGATVLVLVALIYLNLTRKENFPKYW